MEQNLPIITKKLYNMVKLAILMLRKGISKKKLLLDLNLMMKRGKTAFTTSKVSTTLGGGGVVGFDVQQEYEFSCSNTPLYRHYFNNKKKNHYYMSSPKFEDIDDSLEAISKVLETMVPRKDRGVRPLRVTDSPFPLQSEGECGNQRVDEAAEEFIQRFYLQLKEQNC
ncbi:uncharacterized protein LOC110715458 [Chenopodium quinoa]|uniref:uncharacterized protein LOC110715458 n=1 Tax=Chenopodium quinoa TaxID=63459 RepID=UPI000B793EB5|nr:uncharacterized protein LOC110715458 [Chenopodium quinoa]